MIEPWGATHTWTELDPRRPCYTCGALPVGTYRDGSPRYPPTCDHVPLYLDLVAYIPPEPCPPGCRSGDNEGVRVLVPTDLVTRARGRCHERARESRAKGRKDVNGAEFRGSFANDPDACVAEQAVAILWDLDPTPEGYRHGKADLAGGVEVRYVSWADGSLLLNPHDTDKALRPFVLVTGPPVALAAGVALVVRGWVIGQDVMHSTWWWTPDAAQHDAGRRACWRVPRRVLHHPDHLPPQVRRG